MANRTKAMKDAAIQAAISSVPILGAPLVFLDSLADKLEEQAREEKMNALIMGIQGQLWESKDAIKEITSLLSKPQWLFIYRKVTNLVQEAESANEFVALLANVLAKSITSDCLATSFNKAKYTLNVLESLSPQAVVMLLELDSLYWAPYSDPFHWMHAKEHIEKYFTDMGRRPALWGRHMQWQVILSLYLYWKYWDRYLEKTPEGLDFNIAILSLDELYENGLVTTWSANNVVSTIALSEKGKYLVELLR